MTDHKPTTNEEIALKLGWLRVPGVLYDKIMWLAPGREPERSAHFEEPEPPDFEHGWAHAGPLWAELVKTLGLVTATRRVWYRTMGDNGDHPSGDELKSAISHAWLAWKKEEK